MTHTKRTRHGVVTADRADHQKTYVATKNLRWGDVWIEPGQELPHELGRNVATAARRRADRAGGDVITETGSTGVEARAQELRNAIRALYPDRDDPTVLSELVAHVAELRRVEQRLGARP